MPESGFTDINCNTFEEDIECLAWYEITEGGPGGLPPTQYGPFLDVRRDQMASFIARTIDYVDPALLAPYDGTNEFVDVASTNVHLQAINRLAAANVVLGGPGGRPTNQFGPDLPISRAQMASFINRAYGVVNGGTELTSGTDYFDDDNTSVHEDNINALAGAGIVQVVPSASTPLSTRCAATPCPRSSCASWASSCRRATPRLRPAPPPPPPT